MKFRHTALAVLGAAFAIAAPATAAPAQADTGADVFLSALDHYRLGDIDPATAVRVGEQVCPMLAEPGQNMANVAAKVADELGRPLGPATMFTGLAIQIMCPRAVSALTDGVPFSFMR
ncbi:DUF732 domain-containing protein [Mycolicibacterium sp. 018/SC-01/001]|uniref:DUF732 domain-containing protein n=1 Tax=Mycolicibacterium sp. 018/SC-01/001 TaxID=2592069 RepID=UPI00117C4F2F|nr:DUF732 domain-containing protein [Mycolicibacterium sp. 018/SC-01/001]